MDAIKGDIHKRLMEKDIQKNEIQLRMDLNAIPNTDLTVSKCKCGSVLWQPSMILWTIPLLHPKNGYGEVIQRSQQLLVCKSCGKSHPDQLDPKNKAYIQNIPKELTPDA